jgi:hypothetical protein
LAFRRRQGKVRDVNGTDAKMLDSTTSGGNADLRRALAAADPATLLWLDRAIQDAAASRFYHERLWNTGSAAFAGDDNCA